MPIYEVDPKDCPDPWHTEDFHFTRRCSTCGEAAEFDESPNGVWVKLYLPQESREALERLQQLCGHKNIAQTIRAALRLYGVEEDMQGRLIVSEKR